MGKTRGVFNGRGESKNPCVLISVKPSAKHNNKKNLEGKK
jgi:hypothetical protein